jgi:hypothetical protein
MKRHKLLLRFFLKKYLTNLIFFRTFPRSMSSTKLLPIKLKVNILNISAYRFNEFDISFLDTLISDSLSPP